MQLRTLHPLGGTIYYVFQFEDNAEADRIIDMLKNCSDSMVSSENLVENAKLIALLNKRRRPGSALELDTPIISVLRDDEMEKLIAMLAIVLTCACGIIQDARHDADVLHRLCEDFGCADSKHGKEF